MQFYACCGFPHSLNDISGFLTVVEGRMAWGIEDLVGRDAFPVSRVMLWGKWSGSWKGNFMGQKATGKSFTKPEVEIYRFNEEGKIIEHHNVQSIGELPGKLV